MTLQSALELGKWMGALLPTEVIVVGIATHRIIDFGEEFSEPVAQAIPRAIEVVLGLLQQLETAP
jgi:Ni,Fe-hydrogenase maturation factor